MTAIDAEALARLRPTVIIERLHWRERLRVAVGVLLGKRIHFAGTPNIVVVPCTGGGE